METAVSGHGGLGGLYTAGNSTGDDGTDSDGLFKALVSTFGLIAFGYFAARFSWLPPPDLGIAQFVGRVALPSLVFVAIADLDVSTLDWGLVAGIAAGKTVVFLAVVGVTYVTNRRSTEAWGMAGIRGIFVTQSNDFALGLPLLQSMYPAERTRYLYVVAPISFLWLNLMAFALMEFSNQKKAAAAISDSDGTGSGAAAGSPAPPPMSTEVAEGKSPFLLLRAKRSLGMIVTVGVITNPIVFMTALGVICNIVFDHQLPRMIAGPFTIFADAFSAGALVILGMSMSNRIFYLRGSRLVTALMLISVKTIVLPVITKGCINLIKPDDEEVAVFGFIISTFPTAPGVLAFSMQYGIEPIQIASMVVLCTMLSAPIMFVSAKLAMLPTQESEVSSITAQAAEGVSSAASVCCVLTMLLLLANRRLRYPLDRSVFAMCLSTLCYALSEATCTYSAVGDAAKIARHGLAHFGWIATTLAIASYALTLYSWSHRRDRFRVAVTYVAPVLVWLIPAVLTAHIVLISSPNDPTLKDDYECYYNSGSLSFGYVTAKIVFPIIALLVVIVVASRRANMKLVRQDFANEVADATNDEADVPEFSPLLTGPQSDSDHDSAQLSLQMKQPRHNRLWPDQFKHTIYLATETVMLFLAIAHSCISSGTASGPRYEMNFLDVVLNASRGIILFLCFGTDERLWATVANALSPLGNSIRKYIFKTEVSDLRRCREWLLLSSTDEPAHGENFSQVLTMLVRDRAELECNRSYGLRKYKNVFTGKSLVDWMVEQGIKCDRNSAEMLGRVLLLRGAFAHVKNEHHFYDEGYFYRFGDLDCLLARCQSRTPACRLPGQDRLGQQTTPATAGLALQAPWTAGSTPTPPPRGRSPNRPAGLARRAVVPSPTNFTLHG